MVWQLQMAASFDLVGLAEIASIALPPPIRAEVDLRYCSAFYELSLSSLLPFFNPFGVSSSAVAG